MGNKGPVRYRKYTDEFKVEAIRLAGSVETLDFGLEIQESGIFEFSDFPIPRSFTTSNPSQCSRIASSDGHRTGNRKVLPSHLPEVVRCVDRWKYKRPPAGRHDHVHAYSM